VVKATIKEFRAFFSDADGPLPITAMKPLKKGPNDENLPDYDQLANGIGDGTLTYELVPGQRMRAEAAWPAIADKLGLSI
jgi:hypothetical protein